MPQDCQAEAMPRSSVLWCLACGGSGEGGSAYGGDGHDDEVVSYRHGYWGSCCLKMVQQGHCFLVYAHGFLPSCGYESERASAQDCPVCGHGQVFQSEYCHVHGRGHGQDRGHVSVRDCYACGHAQHFESEYYHAQVYDHGHDHGHHPCPSVHAPCSLQ